MDETHGNPRNSLGDPPPEGMRINRYLSQANFGSRRACDDIVRAGRVQIDGETIRDLSVRVLPGQTVRVDGSTVYRQRTTVVLVLHKPVRVLTSEKDPQGRELAITYVRRSFSGRLFSIGRLDYLSSGLLLFTNDGDLAQKLMRPQSQIDRVYTVETREPISDDILRSAKGGVTVEGVEYRISAYQRHTERRVSITLREGKNRELRKLFGHFRLKVRRIHRTRYATVTLGNLAPGEVRRLSPEEVRRLTASAGHRGAPSRGGTGQLSGNPPEQPSEKERHHGRGNRRTSRNR